MTALVDELQHRAQQLPGLRLARHASRATAAELLSDAEVRELTRGPGPAQLVIGR